MRVVIIDYGSGNLRSAAKSFERAARESQLNAEIIVSSNIDDVSTADRIVLPGVGAYAECKQGLASIDGMIDALHHAVKVKARPFLGICVGMQLMSEQGLEKTITNGLGWIEGNIVPIVPDDHLLKIPHMGWNNIHLKNEHKLFENIETGADGQHAYFVHSYHLQTTNASQIVAVAEYGGEITAAVAQDNMFGTQFHPEKSQALGLAFITNFLHWAP